jgi:hypothetical protein
MISTLSEKQLAVVVWAALVAATLISLALGEDWIGHGDVAAALVIVIAFVKVRLVGMHFMELRHAPLPLQLVFQAYCAIASIVLIVLYLSY